MSTQPSVGPGEDYDVVRLCRNFSELSPQPMVAVEGATHIVRYLNDAFSRLVGKDKAELVGRPFAEAVPEGDDNGCLALLDRVYCTGTPELLAEQKHGQTASVYWSYSVWAILGPDERPSGVMIQITDTTETAVFRRQVTEMNEQLLISSTRQHELTEIAEKANQLKDDFVSTLSHELRTPLTVIIGWAGILGSPTADLDLCSRSAEIILRNARLQVKLIDDLFDVQRIITGKLLLKLQPVKIENVIVAAVDGVRPGAETKGIDLQLQLDCSEVQVLADPDRLQQVVWNLISNAIKFTPRGGRVSVHLARFESTVEMTVNDTGRGINAEFLPHVFERFRQADIGTTRAFGGLGLGLTIVRQLVESHGGTVRAESEGEGYGTTFTVNLPVVGAHQPPSVRQEPALHEFVCPPKIKGLRILVVEDEPDTCEFLQIVLEDCGALVETASCAAAALESFNRNEFDVLISDIGMREQNGYDLIREVRKLGPDAGGTIPAVALTAFTRESDQAQALDAGFQLHLPKPIVPSELAAAIATVVARTGEIG